MIPSFQIFRQRNFRSSHAPLRPHSIRFDSEQCHPRLWPEGPAPVFRLLKNLDNVHLIKPLGYESFVYLMQKSYLILTDSGGVQEEAPSLGKPVLVMRETTERPEALVAGTVKLVGTKKESIVQKVQLLLDDSAKYNEMSRANNPYGDGRSSARICDAILKWFQLRGQN